MAVGGDKPQDEASIFRFCKIILGWDYFHLVKESQERNEKNPKKVDRDKLGLREVKNTYEDIDDYLATFEPLLFEEVKAQIIQKKDEEQVQEWKLRLVMECGEADGFHLPAITCEADERESISPNDLLLLSKEEK